MLTNLKIKRNFFTVINQAEVAYRQFLGSSRVKLNPGLRIQLPIVHNLYRISLKQQIVQLPNQDAYTKDNVPVTISGTVFYKITDPEKAIFSIQNPRQAIKSVGESSFRAVIGRFEYDEIIGNRNAINLQMMAILGNTTNDWGVSTTRLQVQNFGPQNKEVAKQLQKQMQAQRTRRENQLQTQAHIRTAEGAKQIAILNSEALLISAKNKAEAMRYQMNTTSDALAEQIDKLASKLGSSEMAANYLLEMKRLEHLQSIANSSNKQVYWMDPKGIYPTVQVMGDLIKNKD